MAAEVFTQLQPYLAAVAEACKEEDGVALTRLVSYGCISCKLAYMFARVRWLSSSPARPVESGLT